MRIAHVVVSDLHPDERKQASWLAESLIANPMSIYPKYKARRSSWGRGTEVLVRVYTDDGIEGIGGLVPASAKGIIEDHFSRLLIGEDPFNVEMLWDQLYRASLPYGRKGLPIMALSAIDIALWDIIGKAKDEPVWRLLGGSTKDAVPVYCTGGDVATYQRYGIRQFKLPMPYGPADGWNGIKQNIAVIEHARECVGPDAEIMLDCYMAWNVEYTLRLARLLEPYRVRWIEECLPPDDYDGYAELTAKITTTAIATGEHEYTRWGFKELIARRCCHILQPDISWVGGITEARRIAAMASAWGLDVVPHAGGLQPWALHFIKSQVNCPLAEWVVIGNTGDADPFASQHPYLHGVPLPDQGLLQPTAAPGFGVSIDPNRIAT